MSIRVLVVDDSALMRRYISQILEENLDVEIFTARDGADALAKAQEFNPDVITLDINMPVMDGLTCLSRIMTEMPCPVVMVSSLTDRDALAPDVVALEVDGALDDRVLDVVEPTEPDDAVKAAARELTAALLEPAGEADSLSRKQLGEEVVTWLSWAERALDLKPGELDNVTTVASVLADQAAVSASATFVHLSDGRSCLSGARGSKNVLLVGSSSEIVFASAINTALYL